LKYSLPNAITKKKKGMSNKSIERITPVNL